MPTLIATRPRPPSPCLGPSVLMHMAYTGADLGPLTGSLIARALVPTPDAGAVHDLATVLISRGGALAEEGQRLLQQTVAQQPSYQITHGSGFGPRLLALVTPGDFMANTPVDFLLNGSDATLILHYVSAATASLDLPPHDVAMVAVGQSDANLPVLATLGRLLKHHRGPVLNNATGVIARLTRDHVSDLLGRVPGILAPRTRRLAVQRLAEKQTYPLILRPSDSHAGHGLTLIRNATDLARWRASADTAQVFAAPFIDYRGPDGLYTKHRVVLIRGRPYPGHSAGSTHWMVHYLNADMAAHPERRTAEAAWMARFDHFASRHAAAFAALHRIFGLDYMAIDCAEAPDGRLLVFEVDTAMIVHDMDDAALFPYKKPAMKRLFNAFVAMVAAA